MSKPSLATLNLRGIRANSWGGSDINPRNIWFWNSVWSVDVVTQLRVGDLEIGVWSRILYVLFYVYILLYCVVLLYSVALSFLSVLG
jgi:hypothetical protein